ncbi:unnamed protein product [Lampetra planeri]
MASSIRQLRLLRGHAKASPAPAAHCHLRPSPTSLQPRRILTPPPPPRNELISGGHAPDTPSSTPSPSACRARGLLEAARSAPLAEEDVEKATDGLPSLWLVVVGGRARGTRPWPPADGNVASRD